MRDPGIFVDFDMLEQQLRAFVGQLDGLPASSAISAAQSGTAPAAASAGIQTAIETAELALRQRLGDVLTTLNEHADLLRRAGQELAEADAGAGTAVVALDTALDSAATAETTAGQQQNPGVGDADHAQRIGSL
jgi:hypothetical protein